MKEDLTPIEELIEELNNRLFSTNNKYAINELNAIKIEAERLNDKDKAHREKYKHTKEDVVKAYDDGWENGSGQGNIRGIEMMGEQYYNEEYGN